MSIRSRTLLLGLESLLALGAGTLSASAQNLYALDDGQPNSGLSYGIPADYCWFQYFDTVGAVDTIVDVQAMFQPGSIPAGTPLSLCVWEDSNDDGDPSDALLVSSVTAVVPATAGFVYTTFPIPPATVRGRFFVGAFLTTDGSFGAISLLDYDTPFTHHAYFATDAAGFFDPALLSSSFYNHIEVLGAGIHGAFLLRAEGSGSTPGIYCTPKVNSRGCTPQLGWFGTPSASASSGFLVQAANVINRKPGLLLVSTAGRAATPFFGGTLCLAQPIARTAPQNSGGSPTGSDCSGVYFFDFNAYNAAPAGPHYPAGTLIDAQFYSRDNGFAAPNNVGLTGGLEFVLGP